MVAFKNTRVYTLAKRNTLKYGGYEYESIMFKRKSAGTQLYLYGAAGGGGFIGEKWN